MQLFRRDGQRRVRDDQVTVVLRTTGVLGKPDSRRSALAIRALEINRDRLKSGNDLVRSDRFGRGAKSAALRRRKRLEPCFARNERVARRGFRVTFENRLGRVSLDVGKNYPTLVLPFE